MEERATFLPLVLGEEQELRLLAADLNLVAARPADEDVRRVLCSFPRDFNGAAGAEGGGVVCEIEWRCPWEGPEHGGDGCRP